MAKSLLPAQELGELENCDTTDPFLKLGYHHIVLENKTYGIIRIFNPLFKKVQILWEGGITECEHTSGTGLFEALFLNKLEFFPYRVRGEYADGRIVDYIDPFSILPVLSDYDLYLFGNGTHYRIWKKLGANTIQHQGYTGVHFAVWAPNARGVALMGDFNEWQSKQYPMRRLSNSGIWEIFIPELESGHKYKFLIHTQGGSKVEKLDPYAKETELRPQTAGIIAHPENYYWEDETWLTARAKANRADSPISIYEVHLGSWRRRPAHEGESEFLNYRDIAHQLIPYAKEMGYTHLEFLPLQEHPLDESWGYQVLGYYSPTKRFGSPSDLKYLIDQCHQNALGVILDWVPAHFPIDAHGLDQFDGTHLYAHQDPRQGFHPQWGTRIFNYGRKEVINFLMANALYWLEEFHLDGLRVDAVASMLYLDYARNQDNWVANSDGSNINHEAVEFLKHLNSIVSKLYPDRLVIAEESSAFPGVTHGLDTGGLGFHYKWNLGWMNDFLTYLSKDPLYRKHHQDLLTFEMSYAFSEKFMLVLSHDEVVHGKGSLLRKMPGDDWQKFANVRLAFAYMFAHPGKKLHFMGMEFGQWNEWNCNTSLDWHLAPYDRHSGLTALIKELNELYTREPALHALDHNHEGFQWVDFQDHDNNIVSFLRKTRTESDDSSFILCLFNFSPVPRHEYRVGVPVGGFYEEILNTDSYIYGGANLGNMGGKEAEELPLHNLPYSISLSAPPLSCCFFKLKLNPPVKAFT